MTIGPKFSTTDGFFKIIGSHTGSPSLKITSNSYNPSHGIERYNIQCYGCGLWDTWLDRVLGLVDKVIYKNLEGKLCSKIIKYDEPLFFNPNCPPHLKSDIEKGTIKINKEDNLKPLIATVLVNKINDNIEDGEGKKLGNTLYIVWVRELNKDFENPIIIDSEQIVDYDFVLYDTQEPRLIELNKEFLASGRLDNLGSSISALYAMINDSFDKLLDEQTSINMMPLFDIEKIGSMTYHRDDSNFLLYH